MIAYGFTQLVGTGMDGLIVPHCDCCGWTGNGWPNTQWGQDCASRSLTLHIRKIHQIERTPS